MDVVTSCLVAFQVSFLMLLVTFDHTNGQPLYDTSREDPFEASEGISYYRKAYGKNYGMLVTDYFFFKHITLSLYITFVQLNFFECISLYTFLTPTNRA